MSLLGGRAAMFTDARPTQKIFRQFRAAMFLCVASLLLQHCVPDRGPTVNGFTLRLDQPYVIAGNTESINIAVIESTGRVRTGYMGTVVFSADDPLAIFPPSVVFDANDVGIKTVPNAVGSRKAGSFELRAQDAGDANAVGAVTILVKPAGVGGFALDTQSPAKLGISYPIQVRAIDNFGNTVPDYLGTLSFISSDLFATIPQSYVFRPVDHSYAQIGSVIWKTPGEQQITASDNNMTPLSGGTKVVVLSGTPFFTVDVGGTTAATHAPQTITLTARSSDGSTLR